VSQSGNLCVWQRGYVALGPPLMGTIVPRDGRAHAPGSGDQNNSRGQIHDEILPADDVADASAAALR
jgi:hypothetical protein